MLPTLTNILNGLIPHPQDTTEGGDEFAVSEGRPAGDYRLAEEILVDHLEHKPLLELLELKGAMAVKIVDMSRHQKDLETFKAQLMQRIGDWTEANLNPNDRADALYNLMQILGKIEDVEKICVTITGAQDFTVIEQLIRRAADLILANDNKKASGPLSDGLLEEILRKQSKT